MPNCVFSIIHIIQNLGGHAGCAKAIVKESAMPGFLFNIIQIFLVVPFCLDGEFCLILDAVSRPDPCDSPGTLLADQKAFPRRFPSFVVGVRYFQHCAGHGGKTIEEISEGAL